jgi:hypothetical protein
LVNCLGVKPCGIRLEFCEVEEFRRGIDDFIEGKIDITLFRKLIDAFISGDPVT